jgi:hypothetical protein
LSRGIGSRNNNNRQSKLDFVISKAVDEGFDILGKTQKEISFKYWTLTTGKKVEEIPQYFEEFFRYLEKTLQSGAMAVADHIKEALFRETKGIWRVTEEEKRRSLVDVIYRLRNSRRW